MRTNPRLPGGLRPALLLLAVLTASTGALASGPVLIDYYRGWGDNSPMQPADSNTVANPRWLPKKAVGPYYDSTPRLNPSDPIASGAMPGAHRYAAVQRLLAFATPANAVGSASAPLVGTVPLPPSRANLTIPENSHVLCEYDRATPSYAPNAVTPACVNNIEGAVMYVAVLVPTSGYKLELGLQDNDGVVVDAASPAGTDYRNLSYTTKVMLGGYIDLATAQAAGYGNENARRAPLATTGSNTLVNLRVAWSNWGSEARLNLRWIPPGLSTAVDIPAGNLFDPSKTETYVDAVNDDFSASPFTYGTGGTTAALIQNDTINSAAAMPAQIDSLSAVGAWPAGITLNAATRAITVAGNAAPGVHTVRYKLCSSPTLCDEAEATVKINATVTATDDPNFLSVAQGSSGTSANPVTHNDSIQGKPVVLDGAAKNATVAQEGAWPAGITLDPLTGKITVAGTVAANTYNLEYKLCSTGGVCDTARVAVQVTAASNAIVATPDSGSAVQGTASTPVANVAANDTLSGNPVTLGSSGNATVAVVGTWPAGVTLDADTGAIKTTAATPAGNHSFKYKLCEKAAPSNCVEGTVSLSVTAASNAIVATPDSGSAVQGTASTPVANVAANDTLSGNPVTLGSSGNATVAVVGTWPAGVTLDADTGAIKTTAATPAGNHSFKYKLCEKAAPSNCVEGTVSLSVTAASNAIVATPDSGSAVQGTASTPVANVAANDTLSGNPVTLGSSGNATVAVVGTWPAGVTLDADTGAIKTTAATPAGNHSFKYKLCEKAAPSNCVEGAVSLNVTAAPASPPVANNDGVPHTIPAGVTGVVIENIAANDTVNGQPAVLGAGGNATVTAVGTWPAGISLNPHTGAVSVAADAAPGDYSMQYKLCDRSIPAQCVTAQIHLSIAAAGSSSATPVPVSGPWVLLLLGAALAGSLWRRRAHPAGRS
ncbi:hypothetical protein [Allofranklinella schreckenbergeri]|nr:hypothetical protein [Allofranklinella schreckenbergeri]